MKNRIISFESNEEDNYETDKDLNGVSSIDNLEQDNTDTEQVIGALNVDSVYTDEKAQTNALDAEDSLILKLSSGNDNREEAISDAIDATGDLALVAESLSSDIEKYGHLSHSTAKLAAIILETYKHKLGVKKTSEIISLESFESDKEFNSKVALEDIRSFMKTVWETIIRAIEKSIEWMKVFFTELFDRLDNDFEFIKKISTDVLKQRTEKDNVVKLADDKKYHFDATKYICNPDIARKFTIGGKTITDKEFLVEYTKILWLVNPAKSPYHKSKDLIIGEFDDKFKNTLKNYIKSIIDKTGPLKQYLNFNPKNCILDPGNCIQMTSFYDRPAKTNNTFFVRKPYLGDFVIAHEFNKSYVLGFNTNFNNEEVLENIRHWDIYTSMVASKTNNDGFINFLDDDTVEKTTDVVLKIIEELKDYQKSSGDSFKFKTGLKDFANYARNLNTSSDEHILSTMNNAIGAMTKILELMDKGTRAYMRYAKGECTAWGMLLKEIYIKEKQIVTQK